MTRRGLVLGAAFSANACHPGTQRLNPSAGVLVRLGRTYGVPAMVAVAVRTNGIIATEAAGVLQQGQPQPVRESHQFHLGSLMKAITATMVATLVEEGKLAWSTGPLDIFPDWKGDIRPEYRRVTLDDLFRHRAGLAPFQPVGARELHGFPAAESRAFCARWVMRTAPVNPPGKAALYSNAGPSIAAVMAERITGQRWEELVCERVLTPLGIQGGFGWPASNDREQPWGHRPSWLGPVPVDPRSAYPLPDFFRPAGDIRMSLTHYARFLQVHLAGLGGKDSLLRAGAVQHLHTPVDGYGLGWGVGAVNGVLNSGHVGGAGSFLAVASIWPAKDLAVAVAASLDSAEALKACNAATHELFLRFAS